ncbi:hypothetical protein [Duganella violaceipulchra]|uniref:Uncharacterized protein n=1 Tax=Duganella violaceipulchra TaxID=2849652 RepID=A0AA41HIQ2_9BURK|nr:hypothetical protein [Duganella violaceicalia]MBV6324906.1 hypothetical protein [Duganella violaceicalia]MCP2012346.1 hypothetical protein [Duganella violaceicalia]
MDNQARFDFYEKLYFHEMEAREQMTTRLQIPLALLISTIGMLGFMAQNLDRGRVNGWYYGFETAFLIAALFILVSGWYCVKSAWGHEYAVLPVATAWHTYHADCTALYASQPRKQRTKLICGALKNAVREKYVECATVNASINETRSFGYHMTIKYFVISATFGFAAFLCYFFGELDKSIHAKPTEISVVSSVPMKGVPMATRPAPPPPPPAPPTRHVRDDRKPAQPPKPPTRGAHGD